MSCTADSSPRILKLEMSPSDRSCRELEDSHQMATLPAHSALRGAGALTGVEDRQAGHTEVLTTRGTKVVVG